MSVQQSTPSEILASLASKLPAETFLNLLTKDVYPALDCLPDALRSSIVNILAAVEKDHEEAAKLIALIGYDEKKESLQKQLKSLNKHVKRDWAHGSDIQCEMMGEIVEEIIDWLPTLWTVGVETGVELTLVHNCLLLCEEIMSGVSNCGSRAEFSDAYDCLAVSIKDKSGKEVFTAKWADPYRVVSWLWRDLLLVSLANDPDDSRAKAMVSDIHKRKFLGLVEDQLQEGDATKTEEGYPFHHEHWSGKMRDAAAHLKQLLTSRRITAFESGPTLNIYRSLVSNSPSLKGALLDTARLHFFDTEANVQWTQAVGIFKEAGSRDDLVKVLEHTSNVYYSRSATARARRDAVSYLMVQSDEYRAKARLYLETGITDALKSMWIEIEEVFPGIDEAFEYLDEKIEEKKLTKHERGDQRIQKRRDAILEKFLEIARSDCGRDSKVEDYKYDQRMMGVSEDDSDYEDVREAVTPDIAGAIRGWVAILDKWPNSAEADEMWSKFKGGDDDPLYAVDGIAETLADQCDWDWNHSSAKVHVAEGIRAAYVTFGPTGAQGRR